MHEFKEVDFYRHCRCCIFFNAPENEDPCDTCLTYFANEYSHRPINFKKKEGDENDGRSKRGDDAQYGGRNSGCQKRRRNN